MVTSGGWSCRRCAGVFSILSTMPPIDPSLPSVPTKIDETSVSRMPTTRLALRATNSSIASSKCSGRANGEDGSSSMMAS